MAKCGLYVRLIAKEGQEDALENFLKGALPAAERESQTPVWFALKFGPGDFGIFDAFATEEGRQLHLNGEIAAALMAHAGELLSTAPKIEPIEVLAAKLPG